MTSPAEIEIVRRLLADFAERTGLAPAQPRPRRYLWTDAFAVCTFLELHRLGGEPAALASALALVDQVHETLGRHRPDDARRGWISGLDEAEGRAHPTRGGLRIGKQQNERGPLEPENARLEWERDGQYFHYLTRWMHALARTSEAAGEPRHLAWAIELALAAHAGFVRAPRGAGERRMVWKMSIDLTRPLVASMGQHDPLDGLLTFLELRHAARRRGDSAGAADLERPIAELRALCAGRDWSTLDPLGLGGLLGDAYRLAQLARAEPQEEAPLLSGLLESAWMGLRALVQTSALEGPAAQRLAFRELGLAIGIHAVERLAALPEGSPALPARALEGLRRFVPLAAWIERFWLEPEHQAVRSWREHLDINAVMLASSLVPDGVLRV